MRVVAAAAVAAAAVVVVEDTAGAPAGRLDRNDSDYRRARWSEADGRVGGSPIQPTTITVYSRHVGDAPVENL